MVLHLPINTAFLESRTKDNENVPNFKSRRKSFVYKSETELEAQFDLFVSQGVPGETSRCYIGYNLVDNHKLTWSIINRLQDYAKQNQYPDPIKMTQMIVSESNKKENFGTKRYLIDIDTKEVPVLLQVREILKELSVLILTWYETPNGYHIVTERGFPTNRFTKTFEDKVTVKACHGNQLYSVKTKS